MFKNVLLNCGTSIDADQFRSAADFCRKSNAKLTALNVFEPPAKSVLGYFRDHGKNLEELLIKEHEDQLSKVLQETGLSRDDVHPEVRWGTEFIEAVKMVQYNHHDLLVHFARKGEEFPDAAAMHLLRKCPCPVWVSKCQTWEGKVNILAAVGASEASESNKALDTRIMQIASNMNAILGGKLHVLHCWHGSYENTVHNSPFFSAKEAKEYTTKVQKDSEEYFADITGSVALPQGTEPVLLHGDPARLIPTYAKQHDMDIVVMGSVARTGIPGLLIGNTAEKIINSLECSILTVKPKEFISPVK